MALPLCHRLKGQRVFDCIYQKGRKYHGPFLVLRLLTAQRNLLPPSQRLVPLSPWRCGVVISSKVHKCSVRRNRLRRLLHDHLLHQLNPSQNQPGENQLTENPTQSKPPLWLLISLKPGSAEREASDLLGECSQLLRQAGLTP